MSCNSWNPDDFAPLIDRHAGPLQMYAAQWTNEAADVVQEVFLELLRQPRVPDPLAPWLFHVTRKRALNRGRARQRRQAHEQSAAELQPLWFVPDHEARMDGRQVAAALEQLPLEQREVIVARLWGQLTLAEIAQIVHCSVATVHRRYEAGITALRQRFEVCTPTNPTQNSPETNSPRP